jgi:hypothetical protein
MPATGGSHMRNLMIIILFCLFIFPGRAYPENFAEELVQAVGQLATVSIKLQMQLYVLCGYYHLKNGTWPKDREEFLAYFAKMDEQSEKELTPLFRSTQEKESTAKTGSVKEDIVALSKLILFDFFPLENGDLLIEGGLNPEISKEAKSSMAKCLFSSVAHKIDEGFSFTPSDKAKQNLNYMSFPFKFKVKE